MSPKLGLLCRRARERGALPLALSQRPALALALASESASAAVPERGDCGMGGDTVWMEVEEAQPGSLIQLESLYRWM